MLRVYFETRFCVPVFPSAWPSHFAIVSAWETTGQTWRRSRNEAADNELASALSAERLWHLRIIGYSPATKHAEPSWAITMPCEEACDLGQRFLQDAIYYVEDDQLSVTYCDHRRHLVCVGSFRDRLDQLATIDSFHPEA